MSARRGMLALAVNRVTDAPTRGSAHEANAAIFSADDLSIYGRGSLPVRGTYQDGIAGTDGP